MSRARVFRGVEICQPSPAPPGNPRSQPAGFINPLQSLRSLNVNNTHQCHNDDLNLNHKHQRRWRRTQIPHTISPCHVTITSNLRWKGPRHVNIVDMFLGQMHVFFFIPSFTLLTKFLDISSYYQQRWRRDWMGTTTKKMPKRPLYNASWAYGMFIFFILFLFL